MPPREGQDQIDLIIQYELIDRIQEVEQPDEVEFGVILREGLVSSFRFFASYSSVTCT